MKQLLEQDDGWHSEPLPENMIQISTPKQFKSVVLGLSQDSIVLADFFSPQCHACRSMWPKLKQIVESNPDVTVALINTASKPMLEMAEGFKVSKLPWFIIFEGGTGKQLASFTANLSTISTLRAELAAAKACTDPMCEADWNAANGVGEVEILQET
jgi:thioredoxin-like negative regulator of GroEL